MIRPASALLVLPLLLSACATAPASGAGGTQTSASGTVSCDYRVSSSPARPVDPPSGTNVPATGTDEVTLTFGDGPVTITLDQASAPCTSHSFESLATQGFFTGTTCHRLVQAETLSVLQCGDPTGLGTGGPGYWFNDELNPPPTYPAGTVAMANSGPNTNGSQFFIVYADSQLDPAYTVFGHVDAAGLAVVKQMAAKGLSPLSSAQDGAPVADTTILSVTQG